MLLSLILICCLACFTLLELQLLEHRTSAKNTCLINYINFTLIFKQTKFMSSSFNIRQLLSFFARRVKSPNYDIITRNTAAVVDIHYIFYSPFFLTLRSHCEYLEEFPLQALPQLSSLSGHDVSMHGLIVVVMQYGKKKIDYLGRSRAETEWTNAWKSNFLHPVLYYYKTLPSGE